MFRCRRDFMNPQTALLRKIYSIFILFGLTIIFLLWQFSAKAELTEIKDRPNKPDNYDIRTGRNKSAGKAIADFIEQSTQTASVIEQNKKRTVSAEAEIRSKIPG